MTEIEYLKESPGWIQKFLNRNGWCSINIHGEAKEISDEDYSIIGSKRHYYQISRNKKRVKIESTMQTKQYYSTTNRQAVIL